MKLQPRQLHPIRRARVARGWSQEELGSQLDPPVTRAAICDWERDLTVPRKLYAIQLVDLFAGEITLDDLYRREAA